MSLEDQLEEKIQRTQLKMKEMSIQLERLNEEIHTLLSDIEKTPEQIKEFFSNPENFEPPIWEILKEEKKRLDEKLDLELKNIKDPLKLKKTFSERGTVQPHWIFVR